VPPAGIGSARAQAATLLAWKRLGANRWVGLVAFDEEDSAILLERVEPGGDGTMLAEAPRARQEAAAILTDLHRLPPRDLDLPSLNEKVAADVIFMRERLEPSPITGEVAGITWMIAASPAAFGCGGDTAATPSVAWIASVNGSRSRTDPSSISTASRRGPLNPGPNPSESRSYAWRRVSDVGVVLGDCVMLGAAGSRYVKLSTSVKMSACPSGRPGEFRASVHTGYTSEPPSAIPL
jgi:hypothetical protein